MDESLLQCAQQGHFAVEGLIQGAEPAPRTRAEPAQGTSAEPAQRTSAEPAQRTSAEPAQGKSAEPAKGKKGRMDGRTEEGKGQNPHKGTHIKEGRRIRANGGAGRGTRAKDSQGTCARD